MARKGVSDYELNYLVTQLTSQIDDKLPIDDVTVEAAANKIIRLDESGKLPANILNGIIPMENLPKGAVAKCVIVENDTERLKLTIDDIQNGDTVKVNNTNKMYYVKDDTKLNSEDGYEIYNAGAASSVPWEGIEHKPTTIEGFGIVDAVNSNEVVTEAAANKLLKLNHLGKLPADITGDANTLDGKHANEFVLSENVVSSVEANKLLKLNSDGKLPANITGDADTLDGKHASDFVNVTEVVTEAISNKLLKLNSDGKLPADITGSAAKLASSLSFTLNGDISGNTIFDGSSDINIHVTINSISGPLTLNNDVFGDDLPTKDLTEGRLFFKKVNGKTINVNPIVISGDMYGNTLPDDEYNENSIFFVKLS